MCALKVKLRKSYHMITIKLSKSSVIVIMWYLFKDNEYTFKRSNFVKIVLSPFWKGEKWCTKQKEQIGSQGEQILSFKSRPLFSEEARRAGSVRNSQNLSLL